MMNQRRITSWLKGRLADPVLWSGQSSDMVALHGPDGRFVKVSESSSNVCGLEFDELVGKSLADISMPGAGRSEVMEVMARATCLGQQGRAVFQLKRPDGAIAWAEMSVSVTYSGMVRSIIRDVTEHHVTLENERREERRALKRAEADASLKADYLADLSHEIRTPLGALIGFADAIKAETFGPLGHEKYTEYVNLIHKSGEHLADLVSDLLDLSKLEADKYDVTLEKVDLAEVLEDCASIIGVKAREAGLAITTDIKLESRVHIDPRMVRQIILNLLSNAVKFTENGTITLKLRHDPSNIWISVIDEGVGMSREQLDHVGTRFRQARSEGVRGAKGTGLGLALCDGLAKAHNGELRLASREGEGTTATFMVPYLPVMNETVLREDDLLADDIADDAMTSVLDKTLPLRQTG